MDEDLERSPDIKKDLLFRMYARKDITASQYLAGRLWQQHLETISLQGSPCYDWSVPIFSQHVYQHGGDYSEAQESSYDIRKIVREEIGGPAFADLDRLLTLPSWVTVKLSPEGTAYISKLLLVLSVIFDLQAGGLEFGTEPEEWERGHETADSRKAALRREQPWLFETHRRPRGKPAAARVMGRQAV